MAERTSFLESFKFTALLDGARGTARSLTLGPEEAPALGSGALEGRLVDDVLLDLLRLFFVGMWGSSLSLNGYLANGEF